MSQDWVKEVVSYTSETAKTELLRMISDYITCFKHDSFKDVGKVYNSDLIEIDIYAFVLENIQNLNWDIKFIDRIFVALEMNPQHWDKHILIETYRVFRKILKMLSEYENSWVNKAVESVSNSVAWIQEQEESVKKVLKLEDSNLWEPTNPKIKLNPKKASETIQQAWKNNWNWYYNFPWALAEAEFLGKRIPTKKEWKQLTKQDEEYILNMPKAGSRDRNNGLYYNQGTNGYYWSSSPSATNAFALSFSSANVRPTDAGSRAYGFTVRCLKN